MVSFFKEWALGVCFAFLSGGIIYALSPGGTIKKSIRMVVAIVVICSLVFPFVKSGLEINWDFQNEGNASYSDELESAVEYQLTAAYADEIIQKADYILSEAGMDDSEVTLMTDINDQGSIFIKKAYIKVPYSIQSVDIKIQKELYELFGEEAIIVFN